MTRPFSEPYASVSSFVPPAAIASVNASVYQNVPLITAMDFAGQARVQYDDQEGPYLNVGSAPTPQITTYRPFKGPEGTKMDVYVSSLYELATSNVQTFFLMFGTKKCPATISKIDQQGAVCQYIITAEVPALNFTGSQSSQVSVYLLMESGDGELMGKVDIGPFHYFDGMKHEASNPQDLSRKRKVSPESVEVHDPPVKRSSSNHLRSKEELYGYSGSTDTQFSAYLQPNSQYSSMQQYDRNPAPYQPQSSQRTLHQYNFSASSASSPQDLKAHSPQVSAWSPYSSVSSQVMPSPGVGGITAMSRPGLSGLPSPLPANPPLIRTSTLQQTPSPAVAPAGVQQSGQTYSPYIYSHKAVLKVIGDLDSMAENWSPDEWAASRRIVMFKRSQSGCTITATFSAVAVDDRPPNSICVSCIYWEERQECYVTSVDTIYLLEQLVAARFTVEEKNRIRRNLEGFRPLTVSKAKPDSEEFFKLIMGFPNPKPRNIEKDVKVFPWKILIHALKKIIGKYVSTQSMLPKRFTKGDMQSASPSSTLPPATLTPTSSTGYATEGPSTLQTNGDHISPRSVSRSISGTSVSTAYTTSGTSRTLSPPLSKQFMNAHSGGPPDRRYSGPLYTHAGEQGVQWQGSQNHMAPSQYQHGGGGLSQSRASWDFGYLDTSPAVMPASGHGSRQNSGGYSARDMRNGSAVPLLSEGETKLRTTQRNNQQVPSA